MNRTSKHTGEFVSATRSVRSKSTAVFAKLRSNQGFTLAEQLISMIFIGLLCVVISAGIGAALAAQGNITSQANAEQLLMRSIAEVNDQLAFSMSIEADGQTFESATTRTMVRLENGTEGIMMTGLYLDGTSGESSVILIPAIENLIPQFAVAPQYDRTTNVWTYDIIVKKGDGELVSQNMSVARNASVSS